MCGVFGFSQAGEQARQLAPMIALAMEGRGKDSWGGTNGIETIKRVGPILDSFEFPLNWEQAIFHTRAATVGAVSERNAHPFICIADGRKVIGIHNGHVSNYMHLKEKHARPWAEVDSEHIFQHLAERKDMSDLIGSGTIAWFEDEQPIIHLARWNFGSLECATLPDGSVVFASTRSAIADACRVHKITPAWYSLLNDCFEHTIEADEEKQKDIIRVAKERLTLGEPRPTVEVITHYGTNYSGFNGSRNTYRYDRSQFEKICRRCPADNIDSYICQACVNRLKEEFLKEAVA